MTALSCDRGRGWAFAHRCTDSDRCKAQGFDFHHVTCTGRHRSVFLRQEMVWLTISDTEIAFDQVQLYTYSHVTLTKTRLIRGHAQAYGKRGWKSAVFLDSSLCSKLFRLSPEVKGKKHIQQNTVSLCKVDVSLHVNIQELGLVHSSCQSESQCGHAVVCLSPSLNCTSK